MQDWRLAPLALRSCSLQGQMLQHWRAGQLYPHQQSALPVCRLEMLPHLLQLCLHLALPADAANISHAHDSLASPSLASLTNLHLFIGRNRSTLAMLTYFIRSTQHFLPDAIGHRQPRTLSAPSATVSAGPPTCGPGCCPGIVMLPPVAAGLADASWPGRALAATG